MGERVLIVGSGGREHALAWKLAQSASVDDVICAPGNPGMAAIGECHAVDPTEPEAVADLADRVGAALVVVGPDESVVAGVVDAVSARSRLAFGPSAAAARLEGSKMWMKEVLVAAGIPTARHRSFGADARAEAFAFLETLPGEYVVKTDGLAAGKGVVVTDSLDVARRTVEEYLSGAAFGAAGTNCVIEEAMHGPELSFFALCDGTRAVPLLAAQDYKRVFDNDDGPNTGGMGAYSPVPFVTSAVVDEVMDRIIEPTLLEMRERDAPYRGVLFCGLMMTDAGPKVVEYNVRFGDPECQVIMRLLESDLYAHLAETAAGSISTAVAVSSDAALALGLTVAGYPSAPRTGDRISGIDDAAGLPTVTVFHSGTRIEGDAMVTNGGRVLWITTTGATVDEARTRAYQAAAKVSWPGMHYRRDIGSNALEPS